jgi:hypothetical protein
MTNGAQAFLRIDDFPSSGYEFAMLGRANDGERLHRLESIVRATSRFGVVPEFMVSSHVIDRSGAVYPMDVVFPRTTARMCRLSNDGKIVINAHGMFHLQAEAYVRDGRIDPFEFVGLDEAATARKLDAICEFIRRVFDKEPRGFVAPSWGYEPGVTKRVAARYFEYIADSYDSWDRGLTPAFGTVDPNYGFVHFPETWRYGAYSLDRARPAFWRQALAKGVPIHFLQHVARIPGEWRPLVERGMMELYGRRIGQAALRSLDALASNRRLRIPFACTAVGMLLVAGATGRLWGAVCRPLALAGGAALFSISIPPLVHARPALRLFRDLCRINLRSILRAAAEAGVEWGTLEEHARQIKAKVASTPPAALCPSNVRYSALRQEGI